MNKNKNKNSFTYKDLYTKYNDYVVYKNGFKTNTDIKEFEECAKQYPIIKKIAHRTSASDDLCTISTLINIYYNCDDKWYERFNDAIDIYNRIEIDSDFYYSLVKKPDDYDIYKNLTAKNINISKKYMYNMFVVIYFYVVYTRVEIKRMYQQNHQQAVVKQNPQHAVFKDFIKTLKGSHRSVLLERNKYYSFKDAGLYNYNMQKAFEANNYTKKEEYISHILIRYIVDNVSLLDDAMLNEITSPINYLLASIIDNTCNYSFDVISFKDTYPSNYDLKNIVRHMPEDIYVLYTNFVNSKFSKYDSATVMKYLKTGLVEAIVQKFKSISKHDHSLKISRFKTRILRDYILYTPVKMFYKFNRNRSFFMVLDPKSPKIPEIEEKIDKVCLKAYKAYMKDPNLYASVINNFLNYTLHSNEQVKQMFKKKNFRVYDSDYSWNLQRNVNLMCLIFIKRKIIKEINRNINVIEKYHITAKNLTPFTLDGIY